MLRPPALVPPLNPQTGRPNAELGYVPTAVVVAAAPVQAIGVPVAPPPSQRARMSPPEAAAAPPSPTARACVSPPAAPSAASPAHSKDD